MRGSKHRYQLGSNLLHCINRLRISILSWGKGNYRGSSVVFHRAGFGWGIVWHGLVTLLRSCCCELKGCAVREAGLCSPGVCSQALCRGVGYPSPSRLALGTSLTSAPREQLVNGAAGKPKDRLPKTHDGEVANVCTAWLGCKRDVSLDARLCREGGSVRPVPRAGLTPHTPATLCRVSR